MPGAVLSLGPEGLLQARTINDAPLSAPDIIDPALPTSMTGRKAALGHRRLARLIHDCFGPSSGISRSPSLFRRSIRTTYSDCYRNSRLLDVGCGDPCQLAAWLTEAAEVTGLDLFASRGVPPGVTYSQIPLSGLYPVESGGFDFAIGLFVLEHVLDLFQTLFETFRALRPGGIAVWVTTLSAKESEGDAVAVQPCLALAHWRDFSCYRAGERSPWIVDFETLVRLACKIGFEVSLVLGTRLEESSDLKWRKLASDEASDCEQVLFEMRKVV
ncbi:MAG TPA: methyltransferase domain-containing protein [Thermoanaerobaculia bacterium]